MKLLSFRGKWLRVSLTLILVTGLAGWWQRTSILAWFYVYELTRAKNDDRGVWAEKVVRLDREVLPSLLDTLHHSNEQECANVHAALTRLADLWGPGDQRRSELAEGLASGFPRFTSWGQRVALDLELGWLRAKSAPVEDLRIAGRFLPPASLSPDPEVRARGLGLAAILLSQSSTDATDCRELIEVCLHDTLAANRTEAIRLAMLPNVKLLQQVAPLLDDPAAEVRQAAMLAVGPSPEAITTEDLLRSLHDADAEVRRLCEIALRSRNLRSEDLAMGRLFSDPDPSERLKVIDRLQAGTDLEPGEWLRRLSHDPAAAVRAAAVRAANNQPMLDLSDRMEQMAQTDPSLTVRQLAQHYLSCHKSKLEQASEQ